MTLPRSGTSGERAPDLSLGEELLVELRREELSWNRLRFLGGELFIRARTEIQSNPRLVRSTVTWGFVYFLALFAFCAGLSFALDHRLAVMCLVTGSVWLGLSSVWILIHMTLAGGTERRRIESLNIPNLITLLRSQLIPPIVMSAGSGHILLAGVLFAAGGASDVLDGMMARRSGQTTRVGEVLDHLVDILFFGATFFSLVGAGLLSPWVAVLAGIRYGLILSGGACVYILRGPVQMASTTFGRFSGFVFYLMTLVLIASSSYAEPALATRIGELINISFILLLIMAILQVLVIGWYKLKRDGSEEDEKKVVGHIGWR